MVTNGAPIKPVACVWWGPSLWLDWNDRLLSLTARAPLGLISLVMSDGMGLLSPRLMSPTVDVTLPSRLLQLEQIESAGHLLFIYDQRRGNPIQSEELAKIF